MSESPERDLSGFDDPLSRKKKQELEQEHGTGNLILVFFSFCISDTNYDT